MALDWLRSRESSLVYPAPPPEPVRPRPRTYILACPRCCRPATIGEEHESMYRFDCDCGGGEVRAGSGVLPGHADEVSSIRWNRPAPFLGAKAL